MKKHGGTIVFVVVLIVVGFFSFKDELHIDIKNPFAGKSEVPDSVVEEMLAETTDSIVSGVHGAKEATYTWEAKHTPDRERHQDTVELTLIYSGENGSITFKKVQTYQYYKENDIWDVCESGDLEVTDRQWNLKKLLDGKTYSDTYDSGASYTVTLSDLDLSAMTVTATYSYTPPRSERDQYHYNNYYVKNLNGERADKLSGTVKCHIEEIEKYGEMRGYYIEKPVGSLWLDSNWYYGDRDEGDVAVYCNFSDPIKDNSGVRVQRISNY